MKLRHRLLLNAAFATMPLAAFIIITIARMA